MFLSSFGHPFYRKGNDPKYQLSIALSELLDLIMASHDKINFWSISGNDKRLWREYKKKFGFPFIIAVKGKNKIEILINFRKRIKNEMDLEFKEAKNQVKKIATFRLEEIIN